jgi:quinol-cytochrome oxidoreductase complex cytochrome b subunit
MRANSINSSQESDPIAISALSLTIQCGLQLILGSFLSTHYSTDASKTHQTVAQLHSGGFEKLAQALHYWGSALLIIHGFLHVALMVWRGRYGKGDGLLFASGIVTFLGALGLQISGNLLPWDKHGVQTVSVEAGIAGRAPFLGQILNKLMLDGTEVTQKTLSLWSSVHMYVLPIVLTLAVAFGIKEASKTKPQNHPLIAIVPIAVLVALSLLIASPLGTPASTSDGSEFGARVSWYTWPLHGAMNASEKVIPNGGWIGAFVLPGLFVGFLFALPLFPTRFPKPVVRSIFSLFVVVFLGSALAFGGSFASLTGGRDPVIVVTNGTGTVTAIDKALAARGQDSFNRLPCKDCHGKDGKESLGGPVLTGEWKKHPDAEFYFRYIVKPTSVQPSSTMPAFPDLKPDQLKELAEFLRMPK